MNLRSSRRAFAITAAGLAVLVVYVLRDVLAPGNDRLPGIDAGNLYSWELYTRAVLRTWQLPHWNPYQFAGSPHLADPQTTVLYPPALLLRWLSPVPFFAWMTALHLWLAGMGALFLARVVGLGWIASAAAAVALILGGSSVSWIHNGHLLLLYTTAWLPWALAFAILTVRRGVLLPHPGLAIVLVLLFLAGYLQGAIYIAGAVSLYFVFSAVWPEGSGARWRPLAQLAIVAIIALGVAAFQLLPTAELVRQAGRAGGIPYEVAVEDGWTLSDLGTFLFPFRGVDGTPPHRYLSDRIAYVGWLLTFSIPFALLWSDRRRLAIFFALLTVGAIALALGDQLPFYRLHHSLLPGLRVPGRVLFVATTGLALLGAIGLERFARTAGAQLGAGAVRVAGLAVVLLELGAFSAGAVQTVPVTPDDQVRRSLGSPGSGRGISVCENRVGASELMVNDQTSLDGPAGFHLRDYADWAYLAKTGNRPPSDGLFRRVGSEGEFPERRDLLDLANVTTVVACEPLDMPNLTPVSTVGPIRVYRNDAAWPRAVWVCASEAMTRRDVVERLLQARYDSTGHLLPRHFVNVRFAQQVDEERRHALEQRHGLVEGALQHGTTWRYALENRSTDNVIAMIQEPDIEDTHGVDRGTGALVQPPAPPRAPSERGDELLIGTAPCEQRADVRIVAQDRPDGLVTADVDAPADGFVFMSEPYYEARRAYVDGEAVAIRKADIAFTAVPVPAGRHRVELRHEPAGFQLGLGISGITLAGWLGAVLFGSRRP